MTNKKPGASRRSFITLCVVAALVVALLAWWQWPVAGEVGEPVTAAAPPAAEAHPFAPTLDVQRNAANQHDWSRRDIAAAEGPINTLCREQQQQRLTALRDRIPAGESPDAAITHALLTRMVTWQGVITPQSDFHAAGRELRNASQRWPDDLDLAWLSLQSCSPEAGCDRDEQVRHLIDIDPDNAVVWMQVMQQQTPGTAAYDQALHRAATSKIYDTRFGIRFLHLQPVLATMPLPETCVSPEFRTQMEEQFGHPPTASDWASITAMATEALPAFVDVARSCRVDTQQTMPMARRQDCMALLARISNGGTAVEQSIGLSLRIQLVGDDPGSAPLRERYRRLRWLLARAPGLQLGSRFTDYMRDGEVATWQTVAKEQGLWPPPPDWLPDDPRSRSLILTGIVPPGQH